jgi:hypothetical protein
MEEFSAAFRKTFIYIVLWGFMTCGWAYLAGRVATGNGLVLGIAASILCCLHLYYQVKRCAGMPPQMAAAYVQAGWIVRLSLVLVVFVISVLLPQISFIAALAGFFSLQLILLLGAVIQIIRGTTNKKQLH